MLRDRLAAARRARVHRRIGEALAETGGDYGEIARHLLAASADGSDPVPGAEAALRAADDAVRRYTYDDTVAGCASARSTALEAGAPDEHRLVCQLGIALGATLTNIGSYDEREAVLEGAWAHATALDDSELLADVLVEAMSSANYPPVNSGWGTSSRYANGSTRARSAT